MVATKVREGFTLVELLIVVALIAIVSGTVVGLMSGVTRDSAETVSIATQKELVNQISSYMQMNGGAVGNGFDSLIRSDYAASTGSWNTVGSIKVAANPAQWLYVGQDADFNGVIDDSTGTSKGLDAAAYSGAFRSLAVCQLTATDVTYLRQLGITKVNDIVPAKDLFHGEFTYKTRLMSDGATEGLEAGQPVCMLDPTTSRNGQSIYFGFGLDLSNTTSYPRSDGSDGNLSGDLSAAAGFPNAVNGNMASGILGNRFLVFGIGPKCTLTGNRKGGFQEAPASGIVPPGEYNRFLLVIKLPNGPNDTSPAFAGILDPRGCDTRGAAGWASRTE